MSEEDSDDDSRPQGLGGASRWRQGGLFSGNKRPSEDDEEQGDSDDNWQSPKRARLANGAANRQKKMPAANLTAGTGGRMTFAQRQMAKMGWKEGEGLGTQGRGRLTPIEVVQRPAGVGVGSIREKTEQVKKEERRDKELRGEKVEDDSSEEERKQRRAARSARKQRGKGDAGSKEPANAWQVPPRKPKYVTVEDLKADLNDTSVPQSLLEFAIDLTGNKASRPEPFVPAKTVPASASASAVKRVQLELIACAESKHGISDQRQALADLETHLVGTVDRHKDKIRVTEEIIAKIRDIQEMRFHWEKTQENGPLNVGNAHRLWDEVIGRLETLQTVQSDNGEHFDLQEVAIAVIHPLLIDSLGWWNPLEDPTYLTDQFEKICDILKIKTFTATAIDFPGREKARSRHGRTADFYETMMYQTWLPRVENSLKGDFKLEDPDPMFRFLEIWKPYLPEFVRRALVEKVVMYPLMKAWRNWRPSRSSKHGSANPDKWIFPWLEYFPEKDFTTEGHRSFMAEVKTKMRDGLSKHPLHKGMPSYLPPWKDLLGPAFPKMLVSHLLPRLAAYLSQRLVIDPSDQDTEPLDTILLYGAYFSAETLARLLAAELFPKFHAILYQWLVSPSVNYDEVTEWWGWWKAQLPATVRDHPVLQKEWTRALETIGRALDLGERAAAELTPPRGPEPRSKGLLRDTPQPIPQPSAVGATKEAPRELTFKDIVADWCEQHDLLYLPTREAHAGTGEPLVRITASADQRGGVLAYVRGDVLFVRNRKDRSLWQPMELSEELEAMASQR